MYIMGADLNFTKPSVLVLINKDTSQVVFSEVYVSSLKEPMNRIWRYFKEYKPMSLFYDEQSIGSVDGYLPSGWPIRFKKQMVEDVHAAIDRGAITLPFSGGWSAINPDEHDAYALAWYGLHFNAWGMIEFP